MGNSLRLCVACLLPCGALDVVRVVHINGHVKEYSRQVTAGEILAANPDHVISKPCSQGAAYHRILIVSPDAGLKRGHIYFLIPTASLQAAEKEKKRRRSCKEKLVVGEEAAPEEKAGNRRRQNGRVAVWRPHLESITEDV